MSYEDYFKGCSNEREYKLRFVTLAKKHHPDKGGDVKVMQEVNRQYDTIKKNGWRNYGEATRDSDFGDAFKYAYGFEGFKRQYQTWDWDNLFKQTRKFYEEADRLKRQQEAESKARAERETQKFNEWLKYEMQRRRELLEQKTREDIIDEYLRYQEKTLVRRQKRSKDKERW